MAMKHGFHGTSNCIKEAVIEGQARPYSRLPGSAPEAGNRLDLSGMAEEGRFELPIPEGITVFETAAFDHSAIPPHQQGLIHQGIVALF